MRSESRISITFFLISWESGAGDLSSLSPLGPEISLFIHKERVLSICFSVCIAVPQFSDDTKEARHIQNGLNLWPEKIPRYFFSKFLLIVSYALSKPLSLKPSTNRQTRTGKRGSQGWLKRSLRDVSELLCTLTFATYLGTWFCVYDDWCDDPYSPVVQGGMQWFVHKGEIVYL